MTGKPKGAMMKRRCHDRYEQIGNGVRFVCCKCNTTVYTDIHSMSVFHKNKKKDELTCLTCKNEGKEPKMVEMTEKQNHVVQLLNKNVNMPTKDIIADYDEYMEGRDSISARHVQRIRKWYIANIKEKSTMNQEDVFDATNGMENWEIDLLNKTNESGWSLQQLADMFDKTIEEIKDSLTRNYFMVNGDILDEDSDGVFWKPDLRPDDDDISSQSSTMDHSVTSSADKFLIDKGYDVIELPHKNTEKAEDDFWEVKIDCVKSCGRVEDSIDVFINKTAREKAMRYMKWAKAREWLAYLIGELKEDGYHVHDLFLPDQRTSAALVDKVVAECYNQLKVIGVTHSHHEMGAGDEDNPSFSGHDAAFINSNHNLSLLAGRNGNGFKVVGIARAKTPCDHFMQIKANVKVMPEQLSDKEQTMKDEFFTKTGMNQKPINTAEAGTNGNRYFDDQNQGEGSYHFTKNPTYRGNRG